MKVHNSKCDPTFQLNSFALFFFLIYLHKHSLLSIQYSFHNFEIYTVCILRKKVLTSRKATDYFLLLWKVLLREVLLSLNQREFL